MRTATAHINCLLICVAACTANAHDGPHDVIAQLDHKIEVEGASARLLVARADEHVVLGHNELAKNDYLGAYELNQNASGALMGLARLALEAGEPDVAIAWSRRGVEATKLTGFEPAFYALMARAHAMNDQHAQEREAWSAAIASAHPQTEWLLAHADATRRSVGDEAALEALAVAREKNPSVLIERAQIELLIEVGQIVNARELLEQRGVPRGASRLVLWAKLVAAEGDRKTASEYLQNAIDQWSLQIDRVQSNPLVESDLAEAISWREAHLCQP